MSKAIELPLSAPVPHEGGVALLDLELRIGQPRCHLHVFSKTRSLAEPPDPESRFWRKLGRQIEDLMNGVLAPPLDRADGVPRFTIYRATVTMQFRHRLDGMPRTPLFSYILDPAFNEALHGLSNHQLLTLRAAAEHPPVAAAA